MNRPEHCPVRRCAGRFLDLFRDGVSRPLRAEEFGLGEDGLHGGVLEVGRVDEAVEYAIHHEAISSVFLTSKFKS